MTLEDKSSVKFNSYLYDFIDYENGADIFYTFDAPTDDLIDFYTSHTDLKFGKEVTLDITSEYIPYMRSNMHNISNVYEAIHKFTFIGGNIYKVFKKDLYLVDPSLKNLDNNAKYYGYKLYSIDYISTKTSCLGIGAKIFYDFGR